jgi:hypothetical protein
MPRRSISRSKLQASGTHRLQLFSLICNGEAMGAVEQRGTHWIELIHTGILLLGPRGPGHLVSNAAALCEEKSPLRPLTLQ